MSRAKKEVRDVQARTGWVYTFALFLVRSLGYEEVSRAIDENEESMVTLGVALNQRAKEANAGRKP